MSQEREESSTPARPKAMALLSRELAALSEAMVFYTRLRLPAAWLKLRPTAGAAAKYWPLVGGMLAMILVLVHSSLSLCLAPLTSAALTVLASLLITGALHEDGLADSIDGLGGGGHRDHILKIMKEPGLGTYGALALILSLILRIAALAELPTLLFAKVMLLAQVASRANAASLMASLDYIQRQDSKVQNQTRRLGPGELGLVVITGLAPAFLLPPWVWSLLLGLALLRFFWAKQLRTRLGGYTGDNLGALQQLGEVAILLGAAAWT